MHNNCALSNLTYNIFFIIKNNKKTIDLLNKLSKIDTLLKGEENNMPDDEQQVIQPRYRSILTIPEYINFGLEIEMENVDYEWLYFYLKDNFYLFAEVKQDRSLNSRTGAEIITTKLQNREYTWEMLKKLGELIKRLNPDYSRSSFQVNFDLALLPTTEERIRFLKIYAMYEDIIYRFSKGIDEEYRSSIDQYATPIILSLKDRLRRFDEEYIVDSFSDHKHYGIAFKTRDRNLIEFRTPNSTDNIVLWQNYITAFYYLIQLTYDKNITNEQLDRYIDNFNKTYILESYEQLKEIKARVLAKKMFADKTDELYFLGQYLGRAK